MTDNTTLGIKVDSTTKERLQASARKLNCTPHWLHKQALMAYLDKIERGEMPKELAHLSTEETTEEVTVTTEEPQFYPPFFEFGQDIQSQSVLRSAITSAYRRPETECVPVLLQNASIAEPEKTRELALRLVKALKEKTPSGGVESLIQEFALSSQEGIALMCLAEALLRIPDRATRDALIRDKISHGDWKSHMGGSPSMFVNAATWGLMITGKLVAVNSEKNLSSALTRMIAKGGEPLIRKGVDMAMRMMGEQFVTGETIADALANSRKYEAKGFRYSYDMLGEAATTEEDAERYYRDYEQAIHAIGKASAGRGIYEGPGISIKLSALHPRYSRAQYDRVMSELLPRVIKLTQLCRHYDIGLNIDAEEADRLEISLDLLEALCQEPSLQGWNGIGFVIQAYQKRAPFVIDFVIDLARRTNHRLMVRLVKGAYWDSEIKRAQLDGLEGYPVYTRKVYTDVSYLACAKKLLSAPEAIYPQFATHNAQTLSSIYHLAGNNYYRGQYEFQCLHGMGEPLYEEVVGEKNLNRPCRVYAPVGTHETLLAYLVRRLLENGANTSFVNQVASDNVDINSLVQSPIDLANKITPLGAPHEKIPLPRDLYKTPTSSRENSTGLDLSNEHRLGSLAASLLSSGNTKWQAAPSTLADWDASRAVAVINPADRRDKVGEVIEASSEEVAQAIDKAQKMSLIWQSTPITERAALLRRAGDLLEGNMQNLLGLITREAGKSFNNGIAEVREAVDFLRYYADQIEENFDLEQQRPLGTVVCISPWNFPLAIFMGQVAAALAAGNTVLAKPAEQTPLIAAQGIAILHAAGIPADAVQLLPGRGETVGDQLISSDGIHGVMFTGSTEVARLIASKLATRLDKNGHAIPLIAETGGQNAMIVDSSALAEQVVADVLNSAFDSAGQRCSALRILCLQEDGADRVLGMIKGAMHELRVGNPHVLSTDVGPVIDEQAKAIIDKHVDNMRAKGHKVEQIKPLASAEFGTFVPPTLIEINSVKDLEREVFGPVLHVLRYQRENLDQLINDINATGYGLTFGIHSRIDETIQHVTDSIHAGNIYVNRNIVGAVVGVQPFGGQGLSGTGPKAGGPLYLFRLLSAGNQSLPKPFNLKDKNSLHTLLPGPTGESNAYRLIPRGTMLAVPATALGLVSQLTQLQQSGNKVVIVDTPSVREWLNTVDAKLRNTIRFIQDNELDTVAIDGAVFEGDSDMLRELNIRLSKRSGPIVIAYGLSSNELRDGASYPEIALVHEQSISTNTAAAGGNASLMTIL
ncbi:trifunctional transcriptional regulator/proline dehydrogenase/L-glutamate gamma-semialdehyde dehydrogenase [Pelistega europaea]|uniref:Bifunctional protein PutA n=1 Tax=Pelistega europaea TaxID=106147 RepID=A0A7Y4P4R3_9BURK|nr:trifunctional transcriptional regulator/proline dehydrogenase/L-glutamate gamma-semialdehyde dehydrogenase [Pelistega europaea]NOL50337.1 trifunctional transcriptional regulator/proline dehydrogenase/L-glutamate gamma-semialdehyde dehydrogenase [Pelistega europaea]